MSIEFSKHAKERLKKRSISPKLIKDIVENPDEILSTFRGRKLRRRRFSSKILEVVTKTEGSKITIITAYFLEENNEN